MSVRSEVLLWAQRIVAKRGASPHELLELGPAATLEEAQAAFHKIARLAHPDLHRNAIAPEELELIVTAYTRIASAYHELRAGRLSGPPTRPLQPDPPPPRQITQPLAPPTRPTTQPRLARPLTQPPATTARPITQPPATTARPITQPPATTARPITQPPATTARPITQPPATTARPITQPRLARPLTQPPPVSRPITPSQLPPRPVTQPPEPPLEAAAVVDEPAAALSPAAMMSPRALTHYRKAELCLRRGDLKGAVLQLKMAIASDPQSTLLRTALAEVEAEIHK